MTMADNFRPARMTIIGSSLEAVRLRCEICGSHRVVERRRLGVAVRCSTCDALRAVLDRRVTDIGHAPERRASAQSL
jgi:hypothetical protein